MFLTGSSYQKFKFTLKNNSDDKKSFKNSFS
jgi:hypothetical protein